MPTTEAEGVALELERLRRSVDVGFATTRGDLALLLQRADQTDPPATRGPDRQDPRRTRVPPRRPGTHPSAPALAGGRHLVHGAGADDLAVDGALKPGPPNAREPLPQGSRAFVYLRPIAVQSALVEAVQICLTV
jgi:hypothetical protein